VAARSSEAATGVAIPVTRRPAVASVDTSERGIVFTRLLDVIL